MLEGTRSAWERSREAYGRGHEKHIGEVTRSTWERLPEAHGRCHINYMEDVRKHEKRMEDVKRYKKHMKTRERCGQALEGEEPKIKFGEVNWTLSQAIAIVEVYFRLLLLLCCPRFI